MATFIYEFTITRRGRVWIGAEDGDDDACNYADNMASEIATLLEKDEGARNMVLGETEIEYEEIMNRDPDCDVNDWNELCEDADLHELKVYENDDYFFSQVLGVGGRKLIELVAKSKGYNPEDHYVNVDEHGYLISSDDPMDLVEVSDLMPTYDDVMKGAK